jgi:hypothetical protein
MICGSSASEEGWVDNGVQARQAVSQYNLLGTMIREDQGDQGSGREGSASLMICSTIVLFFLLMILRSHLSLTIPATPLVTADVINSRLHWRR